ncbi:2038_t:CDS:2 [Dentiscutata heterogama]|uniref:2038_t:CDS:1 n=1 Tax=Dentiscutata heterogama TaxID=1316150 RepID=A0ACA9LQV3_9GLOM|nr:2038_t:CDS:2 [Dentiscutata heterogama]
MNKIKKRKENSDTSIKKRISLTGAQKKELCEKKRNNPNLKGVNLAKEYGISEQSVSDILKRSEYWLGLNDASTLIQAKRQRKPDNPELEEAMSIWAQYRRIFCQNRLEAYDAITEDNLVPPDVTLYDAINFVAQAWKNVTSSTIIRSWGRAGILPSMENLDDTMHEETELEASASEEAELEAEIINLIECLPIDDPLDVQEYIEIDNYMNIEEDLTINEIVDIVNGQDESESEKEQEEMVKIGDAIVGLDNLIKYVQQNDLEITSSLMKDLCSLKKYISYLRNESKRQATLEEFINLTV